MKTYYNGQRSRRRDGTESGTQGEKKRVSQDNPVYTALRNQMLFIELTEEQKDQLATVDKDVRKRIASQVRQDLLDEGILNPDFSRNK